jgi:hypothetical protein
MRFVGLALIVLSLALLHPALALADAANPWQTTMAPPAVSSYLAKGQRVMVVAAGPASPALSAATTALTAALRDAGELGLVMTADQLGDVGSLDDGAIVTRASAAPIDRIAVVRVFPGGKGQPTKVVVTIYGKKGKAVAAFAGTEGQAIAPNPDHAGVGDGVTTDATGAVEDSLQDGAPVAAPTATEGGVESAQYIGHEDYVIHNGYGVPVGQTTVFWQGPDHRPIGDTPALLEALGDHEAASRYYQARNGHGGQVLAGVVIAGAGVAVLTVAGYEWLVTDPGIGDYDVETEEYVKHSRPGWISTAAIAGVVITTVGVLVLAMSPSAPAELTRDEALSRVRKHNAELTHPTTGATAQVTNLSPCVLPGGGGMIMSGTF